MQSWSLRAEQRMPQMFQEKSAVRRLLSETHRSGDTAAAGTPDSVVVHEAIAAGKGWLVQQRREPIGKDTGMNEQHRLTAPANLELEFNAAHDSPIHYSPRRVCNATPPVQEA
jgi:hypothetical protein